jgi:hypothetical protein
VVDRIALERSIDRVTLIPIASHAIRASPRSVRGEARASNQGQPNRSVRRRVPPPAPSVAAFGFLDEMPGKPRRIGPRGVTRSLHDHDPHR